MMLFDLRIPGIQLSVRAASDSGHDRRADPVQLTLDLAKKKANQRCGAWYVRPSNEFHHAYFKSTDGHIGVSSYPAQIHDG